MLCHLSLRNGMYLDVGAKAGMLNSSIVCVPYQRYNIYIDVAVLKNNKKNLLRKT